MRWLRLYDDTINDPKILKLPEATRWHWIAMLCIASKNNGALPALDDISIQLRVTAAKATEIIAALTKAGLLDKTETGFAPHNWSGRQYKSDVSNERVKRYRQRKCNVTEAVTVTPPETEADTEQKQKDSEPNGSGAGAPIDPSIAEREYFSRGREVLGKSSGGQLAKLLKANGGNVSLSRSTLELAATKHKPAEFFARAIAPVSQGPPAGKGGFVSVLMDKHRERQDDTGDFETSTGEFGFGSSR
jgi:hypothetical protein